MSDLKAKIHQIRFWQGLLPRPSWGSLQRSPRGPSESFAVVCTLVHCDCFVSILFAMPIPDTFASDVGKSDSSICVNIVVQTSVFWLWKALLRKHNFSVSVALLPSPQAVNSLRKRVKTLAAGAPLQTPLGELTTLPKPPSRLGRDTPPQTPSRRRLRHDPPRKCLVMGLKWQPPFYNCK